MLGLSDTMSYWVLKSVAEDDVNYKSNDGYEDDVSTKYLYDSTVSNHKQIKVGDFAVIVDKEKVLGLAKISDITTSNGTKEIRRCPICENKNSTYDVRKTKVPVYRCNKGHEFDTPDSETIKITKYKASYTNSFRLPSKTITVDKLRPYFHKNYNQNMSMQSLNPDFFEKYLKSNLYSLENIIIYTLYPSAEEGEKSSNDQLQGEYIPTSNDERQSVFRAIMHRRGQHSFRARLLKQYGEKCMITGCEILDVIEAAHINPYRGEKDNHLSNGLLLRADIHTLFDLDLIGIDPDKNTIHLNKSIIKDGYKELEGAHLQFLDKKKPPSKVALELRWKLFLGKR